MEADVPPVASDKASDACSYARRLFQTLATPPSYDRGAAIHIVNTIDLLPRAECVGREREET